MGQQLRGGTAPPETSPSEGQSDSTAPSDRATHRWSVSRERNRMSDFGFNSVFEGAGDGSVYARVTQAGNEAAANSLTPGAVIRRRRCSEPRTT
jgi:hypothetical protein